MKINIVSLSKFNIVFLLEVSWIIYIVVKNNKKEGHIYEPFENQEIEKPKGDLSSYLYNKLNIGGITKDN